jgi:hypothetical protein
MLKSGDSALLVFECFKKKSLLTISELGKTYTITIIKADNSKNNRTFCKIWDYKTGFWFFRITSIRTRFLILLLTQTCNTLLLLLL